MDGLGKALETKEEDEEFSFKKYFIPLTNAKAVTWIIIIGLIVYFNVFLNGFVGDDFAEIVNNYNVHSFLNIPSFFSGGLFYNGGDLLTGDFYRPLLTTLFSFLYSFFGATPFGFHLFQISLFIVNACFLFLILKNFFNKSVSFILSLIFLVHPINSEEAIYISGVQDTLFFFFGILSLWILQKFHSKKSLIIVSLLLFFSLLSKETGILFVFITLLYAFLYKRESFYYLFRCVIVVFFMYGLLRIHAIGLFIHHQSIAPIGNLSLLGRIINMPLIFLSYFQTFLFPINLSVSYQWIYTKIDFIHFILPAIIDIFILVIIFLIGFYLYKKSLRKIFKAYLFFATWLLLSLLFHLQIIPLDQTFADHWFYLPSVGALGIIGVFLDRLKFNQKNIYVFIFLIIIIVLLSVRTIIRSYDFRDDLTLVEHDSKVTNAYNLENELSVDYREEGRYKDAAIHAEKSIQLYPNFSNYDSLGDANIGLEKYPEAKIAYLKSLTYGDYFITYDNMASLSLSYGNPSENIRYIKNISLKKFPYDSKLWFCLAILEYLQKDIPAARADIQQAYKYGPSAQVASYENLIMNNEPIIIKK